MSAHPTPILHTLSHPNITSSTTPTPAQHDFNSPSAFVVNEAYTTHPSTPLAPDMTFDLNGASTSMDESFCFASFTDFSQPPQSAHRDGPFTMPAFDHTTPSAPTNLDDDRTPVVSDKQHPIPASALPGHPGLQNQDTIRASQQPKPLLSPFRSFPNHSQMIYSSLLYNESPGFIDPSATFYHAPSVPGFLGASPGEFAHAQVPMPPQFVRPMAAPLFPGQQPFYPGQAYDYAPPRSRNGSPTSSVSSSAVSLTRSASTSSELRPARPKVKLTFEDKRNIVELHRSNSSLRQEDIARQYGVDRSTISKIILSAHRWTQPQEPQATSAPKQMKSVGGRFPAIEAKMHEWMDQQIARGFDVRDNVARDQAKAFAKEIGFPMERFKASAKWLDKFKDRRKAAGKPTTSPMHFPYAYYPFTGPYPAPSASPISDGIMLSRSESAVTLSSSGSSQEQFQPNTGFLPLDRMAMATSDTHLPQIDTTMAPARQRSQSSPQVADPGPIMPSSGKAIRPSPLALQRQNSYHGSSPSPRRPVPLSRANSSQVPIRRSRPTSLAASAFGITPLGGDGAFSPLNSPSASSSGGTHSRQRSDASSLAPFTSTMGGMTISPDMSDSGDGTIAVSMTVPPLTPLTPASVNAGTFAASDYEAIQGTDMGVGVSVMPQYATMPNKHFVQHQYAAYPGSDFAPSFPQQANENTIHPVLPAQPVQAQWS